MRAWHLKASFFFGQDITGEAKQVRATVGYMPESDSFIAKMSCVQFVRLMAELSGIPSRHALERAHEALFYVGLGEARYRPVDSYSLGMKQLGEDPWVGLGRRYPTSTRLFGKVTNITDYGAFVELEPGIEGLIHVSEMSWSKKVKHPSKILAVGQEVECQVLGIDQEAHRISLGLKQTETNPWMQLVEKYPVGSRVKGAVVNLMSYGAFVLLDLVLPEGDGFAVVDHLRGDAELAATPLVPGHQTCAQACEASAPCSFI